MHVVSTVHFIFPIVLNSFTGSVSLNSPPLHPTEYSSRAGSPAPSMMDHASDSGSLHPSDSISSSGIRGRSFSRSNSFHRAPSPSMFPPANIPWGANRKKLYENRILRLTASAGFPLSWVDNPEWQTFREEFLFGSPNISRKVLTQRILREVVDEFRKATKEEVRGKEVTMQSDGWTGLNHHHLLAFMVTAEKKVRLSSTVA